MKIYAYFEEGGVITHVQLLEPTEDHSIQEYIDKANEWNKNLNRDAYVIFDIDDEKFFDVILYLLGQKKYKHYSDIDDLDDSVNKLSSDLSSIYDDVYDMSQSIERVEKLFVEIKEKYENLNKND